MDSGMTPHTTTAGRAGSWVFEYWCTASVEGIAQDGVGRLGCVLSHDDLVLRLGGSGEDVLDVEADRLGALQLCALWIPGEETVLVEVGFGGQRDVHCARRRDSVGESGARHEPHVIAPLHEATGNRQQWTHVAVDRDAGDDDR